MSNAIYTPYQSEKPPLLDVIQKVGISIGSLGLLVMLISWAGVNLPNKGAFLLSSILMIFLGIIIYSYQTYKTQPAGIKNNGNFFSIISNRGIVGWGAGILITGFYICLYQKASWLGLGETENSGFVALFDPLSQLIHGKKASQWFLYGTLYTVAIVGFGIKYILKYRHNRYQVIRTISVMCFQLFFAYLIPEIMEMLHPSTAGDNYFGKDLKNMWPLDYDFFDKWHIMNLSKGGMLGYFFLFFGLAMIFIVSPILTYKYGKRWYCSFVCGCGGLAETAGDPFRHLSDKSMNAWKLERWTIHLVLLFSFLMTIAVIYGYLGDGDGNEFWLTRNTFTYITLGLLLTVAGIYYFLQTKNVEEGSTNSKYIVTGTIALVCILLSVNWLAGSSNAFILDNYLLKSTYGLYVGAIFSGIIGVGFYPLLGSRVWCRFGCPMAAILGIQQKLLSRFRITTNGSQCISCGNCSTYCEMGIDVRAYAQKGQNIVRSSCVGCGVCSAVCPRGVLKLENGSDIFSKTEDNKAILITEDMVRML